MHTHLALAGLCLLALSSSCRSKKVQDEASPVAAVLSESKTLETPVSGDAQKKKKSRFELYPPIFTVYPLTQPEPGHPFYFGYANDAERPYQTVLAYVVAAEPDFHFGEAPPPVLLDPVAYEDFMNDWAVDFQRQPELVAKLNELARTFTWQVDPEYFEDKAEVVPVGLLDEQPLYMQKTQLTLARRLIFKKPGMTTITGDINGSLLRIPFVIQDYTKAQIDRGRARYEQPDAACSSCHSGPDATRGAWLKHSSDFLAYFTDAQIISMFKNSTNPDGSLFLEGLHVNPFVDELEEAGMVAYLRNMLPWFDKVQRP